MIVVAPLDRDADGDVELELIDALAEVREAHGVAATYQRAWGGVVSGTIPARRVGRRWRVRRADLPAIAEALSRPMPDFRAGLPGRAQAAA